MSADTATQFLQQVYFSPDLQNQLRDLDLVKESPEDQAKLLKIAADAGFVFTIEDWRAGAKELAAKQQARFWAKSPENELTDDQLDAVAGGKGNAGQEAKSFFLSVTIVGCVTTWTQKTNC